MCVFTLASDRQVYGAMTAQYYNPRYLFDITCQHLDFKSLKTLRFLCVVVFKLNRRSKKPPQLACHDGSSCLVYRIFYSYRFNLLTPRFSPALRQAWFIWFEWLERKRKNELLLVFPPSQTSDLLQLTETAKDEAPKF